MDDGWLSAAINASSVEMSGWVQRVCGGERWGLRWLSIKSGWVCSDDE